jgi:hypothetical protein
MQRDERRLDRLGQHDAWSGGMPVEPRNGPMWIENGRQYEWFRCVNVCAEPANLAKLRFVPLAEPLPPAQASARAQSCNDNKDDMTATTTAAT